VGVITDGNWGLFTSWRHLDCTVFHKSIEDGTLLDGFSDLKVEDQVILGLGLGLELRLAVELGVELGLELGLELGVELGLELW
jgi:hypothetical protein